MNATIEEVQRVIQEEFPGAEVNGIREENHHISGRFDWAPFRGMEIEDRLAQVRKKVRNRLGLRGLNVGTLYPMVPGEKL